MTKMAKTKFARKNEYMRLSETKDWKTGQDFAGRPKRKLLCHILIHSHLQMQNDLH